MKVLLDGLLPRLFPGLLFLCVPHEGRHDLKPSIPRKLRAWQEPGVRFCVIRDNDGADCRELKEQLVKICQEGGREDTLVRIACQELEAWYLGAPDALAHAFGDDRLPARLRKRRFRDPDAISRPSAELAKLVPEFQKVSGARRLAPLLPRESRSRSFQALMAGINRLAQAIRRSQGGA